MGNDNGIAKSLQRQFSVAEAPQEVSTKRLAASRYRAQYIPSTGGKRMADCDACVELKGKPVEQEPHDGLRVIHTAVRTDGDFITYICSRCNARWQRFKADAGRIHQQHGPPHSWIRL